jgi:hypothetical protein
MIENLYSTTNKAKIFACTKPVQNRLQDGINEPGRYRLKINVSAKGVPAAASASLIFDWSDYQHVSLTRE